MIMWPFRTLTIFKGTVSRFLASDFFHGSVSPGPIRTVTNFFKNLQRYSQVKVHHQYQGDWWQICHRYQRHRQQILPTVLLVLLILVAKYGNNIRLQTP
jgi:hypothetical protein